MSNTATVISAYSAILAHAVSTTSTDANYNAQAAEAEFLMDVGALSTNDLHNALLQTPRFDTVAGVLRIYQAAFNRQPDSAGLSFWVNAIEGGSASLSTIANSFSSTTEFTTLYPSAASGSSAYIVALYNNVLGRAPDAGGLSFWTSAISGGAITAGDALGSFAQSAEMVANTDSAIDALALSIAQGGSYDTGQPLYTPPTTFTLTTSPDNFAGGAGDDFFQGIVDPSNNTFTAADVIDGGSGTDTLSITTSGSTAVTVPNATITNVEAVNLTTNSTGGVTLTDPNFGTAASLLNITGTDFVLISSLSNAGSITAIDGSADVGGISLNSTGGASGLSVTTGSGTDSVSYLVNNGTYSLGSNFDYAYLQYQASAFIGSLDGGTGIDALVLSDQNQHVSATITNFEILNLIDDNDGAVDTFSLSDFTGIQGIQLNQVSAGDGYVLTNMTSIQANDIQIINSQAVAPTFSLSDATGLSDSISISVSVTAPPGYPLSATPFPSVGSTITIAGINASGVETVNLSITDRDTVISSLTGLSQANTITITGDRATTINSGAISNVNLTVDGSALTGNATFDFSSATGSGRTIIGGTGNDVLIAGEDGAVLTGGAGSDTFGVDIGIVDTITDFQRTITPDTISLSISDIEGVMSVAMGGATDLIDGSANSIIAADVPNFGYTVLNTPITITNTDVLVLGSTTFANASAVEDDLETGTYEVTLGASPTVGDVFLIAYADGTDTYLAGVGINGTSADFGAGELTVVNLVKLAGIGDLSTQNFDVSNIDFVA